MEKNIKDFLPHYINHVTYRVRYVDNPPGEWTIWSKLTPGRYARAVEDFSVAQIEIELRKLESMTEEDATGLAAAYGLKDFVAVKANCEGSFIQMEYLQKGASQTDYIYWYIHQLHPRMFHYLLSKGFDLFGLLDSGLAIEKQPTTLNQGV